MRKVVYAVIFILLLLVACRSQSREQAVKDQEAVKLYLAMNGDVKYTDKVFAGDDAAAIADLVKAECSQNVGEPFARTTIESKASTLIIYSDVSGRNITCSLLKPKGQKEIQIKPHGEAPTNDTAVVVNGEPITIPQVQQALAALPENTPRDDNSINLLINRLINDKLLAQEAAKVDVTDEEVATTRKNLLEQANLTEAQVKANLERQGFNISDFDKSVKEQAQLQKLLDRKLLLKEFSVSEEEARSYYLENPNQFLQSEQAAARFLLISSAGRTVEQGRGRATEVINMLNRTDFCALVRQYSDDNQSRDKCGTYLVPRGVLDPNLELAVFSTPVNQTSVVTTSTGIYLVQTVQVQPAQVVPFNQVAGNVQIGLRNAIFQQRLNLYLATLRQQAEIVSYLG